MRIVSSVFLVFLTLSSFAKEYKSLERYTIATGNQALDKKDWLTKDRENNTFKWQKACLFNFSYYGGHKEYESVEERQDFLVWLSSYLKEEGHEVKWPKTNVLLFELFEDALNKNTVSGIKELVKKVNKPVFDTAYVTFQEVHANKYLLKGAEAKAFDKKLYEFEHSLYYQPYINAMSEDDLATLNKVLDRKGIGRRNSIPEGMELIGNVQDYQQRLYWIESKVEVYAQGNGPSDAELKEMRKKERNAVNFRDVEIEEAKEDKKAEKEAEKMAKEAEKEAKAAEKEADKMAKKQAKEDKKKSKNIKQNLQRKEGLRKKEKN